MAKKKNLFMILMSLAAMAAAQVKIPGTNMSFSFPNGGWKFLQSTTVDKNTTVHLYSYNDVVVDSQGDSILPFMRIYVRQNFDGSVYDLAYERYLVLPYQSLDEKVYEDGSIGYWGAYTNDDDGKDYEFLMLYKQDKNTVMELRLEVTRDNYEELEDDFKAILASVKRK